MTEVVEGVRDISRGPCIGCGGGTGACSCPTILKSHEESREGARDDGQEQGVHGDRRRCRSTLEVAVDHPGEVQQPQEQAGTSSRAVSTAGTTG